MFLSSENKHDLVFFSLSKPKLDANAEVTSSRGFAMTLIQSFESHESAAEPMRSISCCVTLYLVAFLIALLRKTAVAVLVLSLCKTAEALHTA